MRWLLALALVLIGVSAAKAIRAHYASITWSEITVHGDGSVDYRLQVPFKDLSEALELNSHRPATVAEVRDGKDKLVAHFLPKIRISARDRGCRADSPRVDNVEAAELRAELRFRATCAAPDAVQITYEIFFDRDPGHTGLYVAHYAGGVLTGEFSRQHPTLTIPTGPAQAAADRMAVGRPSTLRRFMLLGAEHLFGGWDHLAFLAALLVASAPAARAAGTAPGSPKRLAIGPIVALVTAFTVAHSITLALAALGVVTLPSRLTECAIACSIVFVAVENLRFRGHSRYRPLLVFCFGLVHGLGFASALDPILPSGNKLVPLLAFNLGLELAQVILVVTLFPLLRYAAEKSPGQYQNHVLRWGSVAIAAAGIFWLGERLWYAA